MVKDFQKKIWKDEREARAIIVTRTTPNRLDRSIARATQPNLPPINVGRRLSLIPLRPLSVLLPLRLPPYAESADSCDSLVLIRLNRDVTSPSFRFDSRADVSLIHQTGKAGEGKRRRGEKRGEPTAFRRRVDISRVMYDRVTGVTEARRERADSSRDRAPPSVLFKHLLETRTRDKERPTRISASLDSDVVRISRIDLSPIATMG